MDIRKYLTNKSSANKKTNTHKKRPRDEAINSSESILNTSPPHKKQKLSTTKPHVCKSELIFNISSLLNENYINSITCYLDKQSTDNFDTFYANYSKSNDSNNHSIYLINGNKLLDEKYCAAGFGFSDDNSDKYSKNYQLAKCYNFSSKLTLKQLQKKWAKQFAIPVQHQFIYCSKSPVYKYKRVKIRTCSRDKKTFFFDIDGNQNGKITNIFQTENEYLLLDTRKI
eukprot:555013_1